MDVDCFKRWKKPNLDALPDLIKILHGNNLLNKHLARKQQSNHRSSISHDLVSIHIGAKSNPIMTMTLEPARTYHKTVNRQDIMTMSLDLGKTVERYNTIVKMSLHSARTGSRQK